MGVSNYNGTPKSSILIGISIIFTIHFGGPPLFLETPTYPWNPKAKHLRMDGSLVISNYFRNVKIGNHHPIENANHLLKCWALGF